MIGAKDRESGGSARPCFICKKHYLHQLLRIAAVHALEKPGKGSMPKFARPLVGIMGDVIGWKRLYAGVVAGIEGRMIPGQQCEGGGTG